MKITFNTRALARALSIVGRATAGRAANPLHRSVLFEAEDGRLRLSATDAEIALVLLCKAKVEEKGRAALGAKTITELLKALPEGEATLASSKEEATLTGGASEYALRLYDADHFPNIEEEPEKAAHSFTISSEELQNTLGRVSTCVSHDATRPVLTGVLLSFSGERARMVATDSYRMALCETDRAGSNAEQPISRIIPARAASEALALARLSGEARVALGENHAFFRAGSVLLASRLIAGQFPDYQSLLPEAFEREYMLRREPFKKALSRIALLSDGVQMPVPVKLAFEKDKLTLSLYSAEAGRAREELSAETDRGEGAFEVCFNPEYLVAATRVIAGEKLSLKANGALQPVILEGEGGSMRYLAMPMKDPCANDSGKE
jgi:DNA polymerase-3 subunit beta